MYQQEDQTDVASADAAAVEPGLPGPTPARRLMHQLREDFQTHHRDLSAPGLHAVALHRYASWMDTHRPKALALHRLVYKLGYLVVRNGYGIELPRTTKLGRRVKIAHQSGIVVHPGSTIGDDCVIRQNVTIGAAAGDSARTDQAPVLGRGVSLGAGAAVIGGVTIGDGAVLGPNVTVLTNVPPHARVMASPPRTFQLPPVVQSREDEFRAKS